MKKGFTLIELLAVILILGIIALIAIPTVNKIINEARYGAFKSGNDNIMKTIEQDCQTSIMKNENPILSYIFTEGKSNVEIDVKGSLPTDGYILLDRNCSITDYYLTDNKNIYSNGDDVRKDYMLKAPSLVDTSIFKTLYPDYYSIIRNVNFINNLNIPENAIEIKDPSVSEKGKIKSWLVPNETYYDLYIGSEGKIFTNEETSYLMMDLINCMNINLSNLNTSFSKSFANMFKNCSSLENLDLSNFNTENATSLTGMVMSCTNLKNINVNNFNTKKVQHTSGMFARCSNLKYLDVSSFELQSVIGMRDMFAYCYIIESIIMSNNFLTATKVNSNTLIDMQGIFYYCHKLKTVNVSNWNTKQARTFYQLFCGCNSINNIDVSKWDTSNVRQFWNTFHGCNSLTYIDVSKWSTNKADDITQVFKDCVNIEKLDLSGWNLDNVTKYSNALTNMQKLNHIIIDNATISNLLDDYIPNRSTTSSGIITIINDKTNLETDILTSKNCNII